MLNSGLIQRNLSSFRDRQITVASIEEYNVMLTQFSAEFDVLAVESSRVMIILLESLQVNYFNDSGGSRNFQLSMTQYLRVLETPINNFWIRQCYFFGPDSFIIKYSLCRKVAGH